MNEIVYNAIDVKRFVQYLYIILIQLLMNKNYITKSTMSIFWMYESIFSVEILAIDFQHKIDVQTNQKLCVIA